MDDWRGRLRNEISKQGIKYGPLSVLAGLNPDYVGRLLKPNSNPNLKNLKAICDALKVSFVYIYTGNTGEHLRDEVISVMSSMTEKQLIDLRDHVRSNPIRAEIASGDDNE